MCDLGSLFRCGRTSLCRIYNLADNASLLIPGCSLNQQTLFTVLQAPTFELLHKGELWQLFAYLEHPWLSSRLWDVIWDALQKLTVALSDYAKYLNQKCEEVTRSHRKLNPVRDTEASDTFMAVLCSQTLHVSDTVLWP